MYNSESGISLLYDLEYNEKNDDDLFKSIVYSNTVFGEGSEASLESRNANFKFNSKELFSTGKHGNDSRIDPQVLNYLFKYVLNAVQYLQRGGAFFDYNEIMDYNENAVVFAQRDEDSDKMLYKSLSPNGPNTIKGVVNPVDDKTGTWVPFIQTLIDQVTSDSEIELIRSKINANKTDIQALNSTVSEMLLEIQNNKRTLAEHTDKITKINVDINNLDLNVKNNANSILDLNTKVRNNTNDIEDNINKLNIFENKQTEFNAILQTYNIRIKQLEDYIDILRNGPKDESGTF